MVRRGMLEVRIEEKISEDRGLVGIVDYFGECRWVGY
jgi:hypothetical protein